MDWKFWLYTGKEYTKIPGWDVTRPKNKVDKYSKKVYNTNVIKRKERKEEE